VSEAPRSSEARGAARLAAVQAVYQMELVEAGAEEVIEEFVEHRFDRYGKAGSAPDEEFFAALVRGVPERQLEIDKAVTDCLSANWTLTRVDSILRAILRVAAFELIARKDVPAKVVIDEYVGIAHAFFGGDEPGFVNAALDRMAHRKRAPEFGETPPDDEPGF
jgi:N utilization substance protein B